MSLTVQNEIQAIQKAKKRLKESKCFNAIIEKNREKLFSFQPCTEEVKTPSKAYPMFAENINALFCPDDFKNEQNAKEKNGNRFRIAVIKADLDGMGNMFKGISDYRKYRQISDVLNESICLDELHDAAKTCCPEGREGWLFPFYIAGDDIFFAVSITNMLKGIDVCCHIVKEVNNKLAGQHPPLSVSIGVEITFNREPIRYYLEMVEAQLKCAKDAFCPGRLHPFLDGKIAIGSLAFLDIDYDKFKKEKEAWGNNKTEKMILNRAIRSVPIWRFFLYDVSSLFVIRDKTEEKAKDKLGSPHFFYTLLAKLTQEDVRQDEREYMNQLLYHLLPNYMDNPSLWKRELLLNAGIIRQIYRMTKVGLVIRFRDITKRRLETYLRLMILFSDTRFNIAKDVGAKDVINEEDLKNAKKLLLTKVQSYLFKDILSKNDLWKIFIKEDKFKKEECNSIRNSKKQRNGEGWIYYYQQIRVEKSMLFKLRDTNKISISKAAGMLALNNSAPERIIQFDDGAKEDNTKRINWMPFDRERFSKLANKSIWTTDFIDSLMLFYQYTDMISKYNRKTKTING